ncbi:uncharacterized protein [Halyomorpha halys]|uniref:uncharacterized protein n=1 Tax=Halyomorpha halys TaxID=286706 RepID=UPI0006D4F998|nr:uncharacterized protein LOC106691084 [Halyomorpha halys]
MGVLTAVKGLTIVFPVLISTMSLMMLAGAINNFIIQKSCSPGEVPESINDFICDNSTLVDDANEVLSTASGIKSAVAAVAASMFGFLRDMTGKSKILLYVAILAECVTASSYFMSAVYWGSSPWIPALIQTFVSGGFGENVLQLGATCIIIQESTPEELPFRLQVFMTMSVCLMLIGGTLTTLILTTFGYRWLFTVCIGFHAIAFLLITILVKEKGSPTKSLQETLGGVKGVFKWRENMTVLWLMLIAGPLPISIFSTEGINVTQFMQLKLRFTMYKSTIFISYSFLLSIIGSMVAPLIMRNVFHCSHLTMGIIASVVNTVGTVAYAFVESTVSLYLVAWLNVLRLVTLPLPNTVISTIVGHDQLGTYLGIAAIITVGIPFGVSRAYRAVFSATKDSWIGAFYFVSAALFAILTLMYSISYCLYVEPKKLQVTESKEDLDQNVENGKSNLPSTTESRESTLPNTTEI